MSRRSSPLQRPGQRRARRDGLDGETDCPGSLLQLSVGLDNDDFDSDAREAPAIVRQDPAAIRYLKLAAEQGHLEAMYLVAQSCGDKAQRIHWLTLAAEGGHVRAMHDLGLASAALHERRRWLREAARHGWAEAMAELGDVECS